MLYEKLVQNNLYDKLPNILKDNSSIRKDELIKKIDANKDILDKKLQEKFNKIKQVINKSEHPLFLFLYDENQPDSDMSWKFIIHDIVHVIKDARTQDIKDTSNIIITKEKKQRD